MIDQQNHANTKLMKEIPKVSDKEKDDLVSEEPANSPNDKTNNAIPKVTIPASLSIYEEDRKINEFLNVINKKKVSDEIRQRKREKKLQDNLLPG